MTRADVLADSRVASVTPRFLRRCRDLAQFWAFIKFELATYQERRAFIWGEFAPSLELAERALAAPSDIQVSGLLDQPDLASVHLCWQKALERHP